MVGKHEADAIVARVLSRFRRKESTRVGMARAVLVVDENVEVLVSAFKEANFRVLVPPKGMKDPDIKRLLLEHRIIVTKNTADFLDDAPVFEYGIIGLEALSFIDPAKTYKENQTVQLISKAISEFSLISGRPGFVLMVKPNGKHVFKRLD